MCKPVRPVKSEGLVTFDEEAVFGENGDRVDESVDVSTPKKEVRQ